MNKANPLKEYYTKEYYDTQRAYTFENRYPIIEYVAQLLYAKFKPHFTLDVGCGKGYMVYAFTQLGAVTHGIDISEYAIDNAPTEVRQNLKVVDVDTETLPFKPKSFDLITATECMEHLQNPTNVISEMARVVKPQGYVFISTPKMSFWRDTYTMLFGGSVLHPSELTMGEWIRLFNKAGFTYIGNPLASLDKATKKEYYRRLRLATAPMLPQLTIGKVLNCLGPLGNRIRVELNLLAWQAEHMAFRKRKELSGKSTTITN